LGLRMITWQSITATAMFTVVNSGFLAAYALALGANNLQIGILAAIPFIMQPFQIPAILLVERLRLRKLISFTMWLPAQLVWLFLGLIPLFVEAPGGLAIALLMGLMALRGFLTAIMSTAWNTWIRDVVPRETMGSFFARRLALSTVAAIIFGLGGAFFVDIWNSQAATGSEVFGYSFVLIFGCVFMGMASAGVILPIAEPEMHVPPGPQPSLVKSLSAPLRDKNFSHLMRFLLLWGFASNLAIPFFTVYMLRPLGLPLSAVIGLTVLSQLFNVFFLRVWGPMADRFGYKSILSVSASLYLLVILGWAFTTMPGRYFLTIPLLIILQIFAGIASAGVNLGVETIGLKLAPEGQATPYLVGASLATSMGAALGPLVGGSFADFFSVRQLAFNISWEDPFRSVELPAFFLTGYDFLFAITFLLGLITLNSLNALREEGEVDRDIILKDLRTQTRGMFAHVPGLALLGHLPVSYLRVIPGMDVAMGVTAYQLASSVHTAVTAAMRGRNAAINITDRVSHTVTEAVSHVENIGEHSVDIARQATRGAMHAVDEVGLSVGHLAKGSVIGAIRALGKANIDPADAFVGAGYGTIQGASEVGADLGEAAIEAVEGSRAAARELGIPEDQAVAQVTKGALQATHSLSPEAAAQIKDVLLDELIETTSPGPGQTESKNI
jgi:MFS family permease